MSRRVQFEISDDELKKLLKLKNELYAATMADAIRSSLRIVEKLEDYKRKGNKIFIIDKANNRREIEFI